MLNAIKHRITPCLLAVMAACCMLSSCDMIKDESDCVASYNLVRFTYDYNMKFADAFTPEVKQVTLLAFNSKTGRLVKRIDAPQSELTPSNEMVLDVEPGSYDLLVWGGEHSKSFDIAAGKVGESTLEEFHAYLRRSIEEGRGHSRDDLAPLFHGMIHAEFPYASPSVPNYITVPLKKDTNVVRVVLQQMSGNPVDISNFNMTITDGNGWLNHDNTLRSREEVVYHPWHQFSGVVDVNSKPTDMPGNMVTAEMPSDNVLGAALAEFTVSRLTTETDPILHVTRKDGSTVLKVNVRDYALLVMGMHNKAMGPQEYLDRQDEYNMTFFLDKDNEWVSTVIVINDWRIVRVVTPVE